MKDDTILGCARYYTWGSELQMRAAREERSSRKDDEILSAGKNL